MEKGTKLICVKKFRGVNRWGEKLPYSCPEVGKEYHYDGYGGYDDTYSCHYVFLVEYPDAMPSLSGHRPKFNGSHFRRVDELHSEWTNELVKDLENEINEEYGVEVI